MKFNNENQNQKLESKTEIENENQDSKSNLKIENENAKWNFDNVIWWIRTSGLALEVIHALVVYTYGEMKELKESRADYKETLRLISKITNDNTIKDIVSDTIGGK